MPSVIDTNHDVSGKIAQLKALGVDIVFRYLTTNTSSDKCVRPTEARALAAAGIKLGLVFEVFGGVDGFKHGDINAKTGAAHAQFVKSYLPTIGAPAGTIVYFAVDTDATNPQVKSLVLPYLNAVRSTANGAFKVGVYACGAACQAALDNGAAISAWLSNAMGWNGSRMFNLSLRWDILQGLPKTVAGLDTDPDQLSAAHDLNPHRLNDIGFIPFAGTPAAVAAQPATPVVKTTETGEYKGLGEWHNAILATVFSDHIGAYGPISPGTLGVALPGNFKAPRPRVQVRLVRTGASMAATVVDKGPHYDGQPGKPYDPYWETNSRPRAETDKQTNRAGIDLTQHLADVLGHNGKEMVNWRFIE